MRNTPRSPGPPNPASKAAGFTLFEVLIALLVLSVGLLGIAGLQVVSKRSNFEALQRSTAAMLVQDILDRIRANPGELSVYTNGTTGRTLTGNTMAATNCTTADCTPGTLALYDLYQWEEALKGVSEKSTTASDTGGLASPTACISASATTPGEVTVAVAWRGLTKLSNPTSSSCGAASGLYDDGAATNVYRRVLVVQTFVN